MKTAELAHRLIQAVYDLAVAPPHEARPDGYPPAEWPIYVEGYEHAIVMALRVLVAAVERLELAERARRRRARAERQAAQRLADAMRERRGEQVGPLVDRVGEHVSERHNSHHRNAKPDGEIERVTRAEHEHIIRARSVVHYPIEGDRGKAWTHRAKYAVKDRPEQPPAEKQTISNRREERPAARAGGSHAKTREP